MQTRVYERDEVKKYTTEVVAEKVIFLSSNNQKKADYSSAFKENYV